MDSAIDSEQISFRMCVYYYTRRIKEEDTIFAIAEVSTIKTPSMSY